MRTLLREAESRRIQAEAKAKRAERNAAATTVELDALRADCTPTKDFVLSLSSRFEEQEYLFLDDRISERGLVCVRAVARLKHNSSEEIAKARAEMHELTAKARSAELLAAYK